MKRLRGPTHAGQMIKNRLNRQRWPNQRLQTCHRRHRHRRRRRCFDVNDKILNICTMIEIVSTLQ